MNNKTRTINGHVVEIYTKQDRPADKYISYQCENCGRMTGKLKSFKNIENCRKSPFSIYLKQIENNIEKIKKNAKLIMGGCSLYPKKGKNKSEGGNENEK